MHFKQYYVYAVHICDVYLGVLQKVFRDVTVALVYDSSRLSGHSRDQT